MKRILFAALLLTAAFGVSSITRVAAQQAAQVDPKLQFASRINEIDAMISRSRTEDARRVFNEVSASMQKYIADSKNAKASTLYTEAKILSADMPKNHTALVAKLREFLELM